MNPKVILRTLLTFIIPLGTAAQGINDIERGLMRLEPYAATAEVELSGPGAGNETVRYTLELFGSAIADTVVAPQRYLIEYRLDGAKGAPDGFAALLDDRAYRYDGRRFSEYTLADSTLTPAVARSAQFASLLPRFLARDLRMAAADPGNHKIDIHTAGPDRVVVEVASAVDSMVYSRRTLELALPSMAPVAMTLVTNEETPAEMTLRARWLPAAAKATAVSRALLLDRQGEPMRRFAGSNRCPDSFIGHRMPPFTLPDIRGSRYSWRPGYPTVLVIVDDQATPDLLYQTIEDTRHATAEIPGADSMDFIYVMLSRFTDAIPASEAPSGHEHLLLGGTSLARELGARKMPIVMLIDADGVVQRAVSGNNNPAEIVIQMTSRQ